MKNNSLRIAKLLLKTKHFLTTNILLERANGSISSFNLLLGSSILVFISSILLISSISYFLSYSISWIEIFLATCISLSFQWWGVNRYFKEHKLKTFVILCSSLSIILLGSMYVSGTFYDLSHDGQTYHQEAIIQLANGWNPFYENLVPEIHSQYRLKLINSFSKGSWIPAAALYKITGSVEKSKAFNFLLILASFFVSFSALICFHKITLKTAAILSTLLSFNPVSICQSLSFYVDGQLSSLLISLASLSYLLFIRWDKVIMLALALNIMIALNVKFTGVVYTSIFVFGLLTYFFLYRRVKFGSRVLILSAISILVGICFIGYSPYIINTIRHGHPFYPIFGPGSADIVTSDMPANFLEMNRFEKLFLSIFSKSENVFQPKVSRLKWPFTVSKDELNAFGFPDTRVGGWGPLFGGVIIISMVILLFGFGMDLRKAKVAAGVSLFIMISIIVNWESWWARFSPQLWIIPMPFIILSKYIQKGLLKHLGRILILALAINVILVSTSYIRWQYHFNGLLKQQLRSVGKEQDQILVKFYDFRSNRVRFNELDIRYKEIKEFKCLKYTQLISSDTKICVETP